MTIPNNTPASIMSPETCPLGISASFCLSDSFFVSLCSQEHTIYTNAQTSTHRQTHAILCTDHQAVRANAVMEAFQKLVYKTPPKNLIYYPSYHLDHNRF